MSVFYPEELVIYSLSFNSFLSFNVENDVLAKVRKNFFEHNKRQSDKLIQNFNDVTIKYVYNLEKKKPMKWLVKKGKNVIEQAVVTSVNTYEIRTFDDNGNKILTTEFSNDHIIKKATFAINGETVVVSNGKEKDENVLYCRGAAKNLVLHLLIIDEDDVVVKRLSQRNPYISVTALTNKGVVYFGTKEEITIINSVIEEIKREIEEENKPKVYISQKDKDSGFNFNDNDFNIKRNMNETFDIDKADVFTGEVDEEPDIFEESVDVIEPENSPEELYQGEEPNAPEVEEPAKESVDELAEEVIDEPVLNENNEILELNQTEISIEEINQVNEEPKAEAIKEAVVTPKNVTPIVTPQVDVVEPIDEIASSVEEQADAPAANPDAVNPDLIINSGSERYLYFGELGEDYTREGYGRTQMENGRTAYEGNYHHNKRNGFGSFYYRDGGMCYCGEWKDNNRNGFGLGVRSSDGSYHAGKWSNNKPDGVGVRFDKYGNLSYVSNFSNGKEKGLSVEFSQDGSISIFKWINDEKKIIQTIYP